MRILHIWHRPYPFDIRVQKISLTLAEAGHDVHIVATNSGCEPAYAAVEGLPVHRLTPLPGPLGPLTWVSGYPTAWNPRWMAALQRIAGAIRPDAMLVRDTHLMLLCLALRRAWKIPLVLDLPEHWPALWTIWRATEGRNLRNLFTRSVSVCRIVERIAIRGANHVLVCVEEMQERLTRMGAADGRVSLVRNTPDLRLYPRLDAAQQERAARLREALRSEFVVVYGGQIDPFRGLDTLIRAVARLRPVIPTIKLLCIGSAKPANEWMVRAVAEQAKVTEAVLFTGWMNQARLLDHTLAADVGAAPFHACEQLEMTLSNKVFDYMSLGRPVLATDVGPIRRLVEETECGLLVPSQDDRAMADALRRLLDPALRRRLGENGLRAVRTKYNWRLTDGPMVAKVFAELGRRRRQESCVQ